MPLGGDWAAIAVKIESRWVFFFFSKDAGDSRVYLVPGLDASEVPEDLHAAVP